MKSAFAVIAYLLVGWLEIGQLVRRRLIRDAIIVAIAFALSLIPAVLLLAGNDNLPPVNSLIRELFEWILK